MEEGYTDRAYAVILFSPYEEYYQSSASAVSKQALNCLPKT
jgi:hypothetical protein